MFLQHFKLLMTILWKQQIIIIIRIRLHLVKHLMIKISEISLTQCFDDSMSSFSSEKNKRIKILQLNIYCDRR